MTQMHTRARILYVDDHQDTRLMVMILLGQQGYGVQTASTMHEALEVAQESPYDLFMVDSKLSDGSGTELCQRLKELQPGVPVLYYTGVAYETEKIKALQTCGDEYLKKPVCVADLQETVTKLILRKEARV